MTLHKGKLLTSSLIALHDLPCLFFFSLGKQHISYIKNLPCDM